jgi:DNA helicase HerA-like ATPase
MLYEQKIWVGTDKEPVFLLPQMANRHGLISGATGTGKTVTLKVLAEGFSELGVPVFVSDVKGDLAGLSCPGEHSEAIAKRLMETGVPGFSHKGYPAVFWDVYGEQGHPLRATVSEMGPMLLSRMLNLNETQAGVLNILFRVADDEGMPLLDIRDLKAMLLYVGERAGDYTLEYGNIAKPTIGAIQRAIAILEDQGGDVFFGEPAFEIADWLHTDETGRGNINILAADKLFLKPAMYSSFMLWMLSELYESLPEQGDSEKPRIVFFFDEAHLLFTDCPKLLMEKIELTVRLIRSKGVGVYFITQNPADVPMSVLGQLGNRVQHALRAFTPLDQKAVKAAAQTFRPNPAFDMEEAITQLKTGEALLSFLDDQGAPGITARAAILPPQSSLGAIGADLRRTFIETSPFSGKYEQMVDRESAYEMLSNTFVSGRAQIPTAMPIAPPTPAAPVPPPAPQPAMGFMVYDAATGQYVQKQIPTMSPLPTPPAAPAQPAMMPVLVYDEARGQYIQQMMPIQRDASGRVITAAAPLAPAPMPNIRQTQAIQKADKERQAEERRQHTDELREERAQRARKNDSVLGRLTNSALSGAGREVGRSLVRGLLGSLTRR